MKPHVPGIALLVAGASVLSGCSTVEQAADDAAQVAACTLVQGVAEQVRALADNAAAGASAQELQRQAEALRVTAEGLGAAVEPLSPQVAMSLQQAAVTLEGALASVPAGAVTEVADEAVGEAANGYGAAIDEAVGALGC